MAMEINNLQKLQAGNGTQTILLIDAFNLFIRHYMANETINNKSEPIGGVVGFLKSLKYLTDVFKPRKVIVCYEAGGGSPRGIKEGCTRAHRSGQGCVPFNRLRHQPWWRYLLQ